MIPPMTSSSENSSRKDTDEPVAHESHQLPEAIQEKILEGQNSSSTSNHNVEPGIEEPVLPQWVDDPINPKRWPLWKRIFHTAVPAVYAFILTIGVSTFVPAIPSVMEKFKVSREVAILPISLYTLGFTIGPVLAAPLSELYGRRWIYWSSMPIFLAFTAIAASSNSFAVLLVFRFLATFGGSGAIAVGAGTIADTWHPAMMGRAALFYIVAPFLGPVFGPMVGAYIISEYQNWRYCMWVIMIIAAPVAVMAAFMSETSASRILYLRQKKQGASVARKDGDTRLILAKVQTALIRPFHMMLMEPLVLCLSIYIAFAFATMFSFFNSYDYVYALVYNFNSKEIGLAFLGIFVGFIFAIMTFGYFEATLYRKAFIKSDGKPAPEHRLYSALLGSFMLPIGLFWFAWSPHKDVHWIAPVLAGVPFGWGCLAIFLSSITYLVDVYQAANGASAVAATGILRYSLGAVFPLFTSQMYEALGIHWAGSVFAFVSLLMMPVPWIFYFKGKVLRARSNYNTSKN